MKKIIKIGVFTFILLSNFVVFAQGDDDDGGGLEGDDPAPTPINGKLLYLGIAGIIFAVYSFKKYKIFLKN